MLKQKLSFPCHYQHFVSSILLPSSLLCYDRLHKYKPHANTRRHPFLTLELMLHIFQSLSVEQVQLLVVEVVFLNNQSIHHVACIHRQTPTLACGKVKTWDYSWSFIVNFRH